MFQASLHEDAECWVEDQAKFALKDGLIFSCDALSALVQYFLKNGFGYNANGVMKWAEQERIHLFSIDIRRQKVQYNHQPHIAN